jgi:hypothetical protein
MNDLKVQRWTGAFGVASIALILLAQPLWFVSGTAPRLEDTVKFSDYVTRNNWNILTRSLADTLIIACFLVFLVGFRYLIRQARADYEWAATLVFVAGLVFAMLTLLGDVLASGAALDTIGGKAEPTVVRALWEGSIPAFGDIGLIIMALFMASAGYAILATAALPKWTGWVAYAGAIGNLMAAPAIYAGANAAGFYTADGLVSLLSELPFLIWALIASISMIIAKREVVAPTLRERRLREAG